MFVLIFELLINYFSIAWRPGMTSRLDLRCESKNKVRRPGRVSTERHLERSDVGAKARTAAASAFRNRLNQTASDLVPDRRFSNSVSAESHPARTTTGQARPNLKVVSVSREVSAAPTAREFRRPNRILRRLSLGPIRPNLQDTGYPGSALGWPRPALVSDSNTTWSRPHRFRDGSNWDVPDVSIGYQHPSQLHAPIGTSTVPLFVLGRIKTERMERRSSPKEIETCDEINKINSSASLRLRGSIQSRKFESLRLRRSVPNNPGGDGLSHGRPITKLTRLTF